MNKLAAVLIVGLAAAEAAHAATIITDPVTNAVYTMNYSEVGSTNVYDISLFVNTSGVASNLVLNTVGANIVSQSGDVSNIILVVPPSPNFFTAMVDTVTANGCNTNSQAGFACSQYTGTANSGFGISVGPTYQFEWQVTLNSGATLFPGGTSAIDALYIDLNTGNKLSDVGVGNLTPTLAQTPEPSSLALLGTGALTIAGLLRRRISLPV